MILKSKKGASKMILVLVIFIGLVLIIAGVGLGLAKNGKLSLEMFGIGKKSVPVVTKIIDTTVDTVPIPTGFYYVGGSKATGLVISDNISDKEKGDSHEVAKTLVGNQYVWIPVDDFTRFKRETGNDNFKEDQVNVSIIETEDLTSGINLWEVNITLNKPTSANTKTILAEAQAMYNSVEKYKGFYVARYEAGLDSPRVNIKDATTDTEYMPFVTGTSIKSKLGEYPYNNIYWSNSNTLTEEKGGALEAARSVYPNENKSYAVVSTLVYGVQWDSINNFMESTPETTTSGGNYLEETFPFFGKYMDNEQELTYILDNISTEKLQEQNVLFTTGATSFAKRNNIYDFGGNLKEWSMEGITTVVDEYVSYGRIVRGGSYKDKESDTGYTMRESKVQSYTSVDTGFRIALYLK